MSGCERDPISSLNSTEELVKLESSLLAHVFFSSVVEVELVVVISNDLGSTKQMRSGIDIFQLDFDVFAGKGVESWLQ